MASICSMHSVEMTKVSLSPTLDLDKKISLINHPASANWFHEILFKWEWNFVFSALSEKLSFQGFQCEKSRNCKLLLTSVYQNQIPLLPICWNQRNALVERFREVYWKFPLFCQKHKNKANKVVKIVQGKDRNDFNSMTSHYYVHDDIGEIHL